MLDLGSEFPDRPLYERIAAAVRRAVAERELTPGTQLPAASGLATELDVHANTVLRAYRLLASEGVIDLRRGRGATVRGEPPRTRLYELADELLAEAARLGVTRGELAILLAQRS